MNKDQLKKAQTVLGTWARAFTAAVLASYLSGYNDPKYLLNAGLAAILPVILRWLNPNDAFPVANKLDK